MTSWRGDVWNSDGAAFYGFSPLQHAAYVAVVTIRKPSIIRIPRYYCSKRGTRVRRSAVSWQIFIAWIGRIKRKYDQSVFTDTRCDLRGRRPNTLLGRDASLPTEMIIPSRGKRWSAGFRKTATNTHRLSRTVNISCSPPSHRPSHFFSKPRRFFRHERSDGIGYSKMGRWTSVECGV